MEEPIPVLLSSKASGRIRSPTIESSLPLSVHSSSGYRDVETAPSIQHGFLPTECAEDEKPTNGFSNWKEASENTHDFVSAWVRWNQKEGWMIYPESGSDKPTEEKNNENEPPADSPLEAGDEQPPEVEEPGWMPWADTNHTALHQLFKECFSQVVTSHQQ